MYDIQGDYKQALEYYNKSLQVKIKVLGKNHPDTADTWNNMAMVYG